ncbi:cell wall anchored protein [Rutstroemia sp. NJR-2017a BVV2]|nr:cell wall anchored protein [Rutstroemia sp. NJR-2017a BVV2]
MQPLVILLFLTRIFALVATSLYLNNSRHSLHVPANLLGNPTSRDLADHMISQESTNVRQTLGSHIEEFGNHGSKMQHRVERAVDINMERRAEADIPPGLDPIDNMCQRFYHASIIKNDILYIYGGYETFVDSNNHGKIRGNISIGTTKDKKDNFLLGIGMNESWTWQSGSANLPMVSEQVLFPVSSENVPSVVIGGALFSGSMNDNEIYLYGGTDQSMNTSFYSYSESIPSDQTLLSYDITGHQWQSINVSSVNLQKSSYGASADVPDQGLGFYFNGEINNGTSAETASFPAYNSIPLEGMVMVDTVGNTSRNISTSAIDGNSRTGGILQYVPGVGEKGILVQFGGRYREAGVMTNGIGTLAPMDEIHVFDINSAYNGGSGSWYTQQASGDLPPKRVQSCSVVATAADNSSYNIYMYAGKDGISASYDDIYVLSLPSFTWTKVYETTPGSPRYGHTCHLVGNRQLLTVGGIAGSFSTYCDWESKGVAIFDLSTLQWGSNFYHDAESYSLPSNLTAVIGGGPNGSANVTRPAVDFTSAELASLFKQTRLVNTTASNTTNPTGVSPSSPSSSASATTNHTGAIAGATIGAIAAILLVTCALWFFRRSANARRIAAKEGRSESRQSLVMNEGPGTSRLRQYVMSAVYDANNPCHVPEPLSPVKEKV